jgi:hypothetical protein
LEYGKADGLQVRGGFQANPFFMSFGSTLKTAGIKLTIALSYHAYLGLTPSSSIIYQKTKND